MKTDEYKIGDRVRSRYDHTRYGTVVAKDDILRVKWDKETYNHGYFSPENVLSVELVLPYIREEKLNQLGI
jgi:hypothetical protein